MSIKPYVIKSLKKKQEIQLNFFLSIINKIISEN